MTVLNLSLHTMRIFLISESSIDKRVYYLPMLMVCHKASNTVYQRSTSTAMAIKIRHVNIGIDSNTFAVSLSVLSLLLHKSNKRGIGDTFSLLILPS